MPKKHMKYDNSLKHIHNKYGARRMKTGRRSEEVMEQNETK